jgi:hypothetical protein
MTDNTNAPAPSVSDAIDKMVATLRPSAPEQMPAMRNPDLRVDGEGNVTVLAPATHPGIKDTDGLVMSDDIGKIDTRIARLTEELAEVTHDRATGTPTPVRTGRERTVREAELMSLNKSRDFQVERAAKLTEHRNNAAATKANEQREVAARFAYTHGNPDKAAELQKAIDAEEAKAAAAAIVAGRTR